MKPQKLPRDEITDFCRRVWGRPPVAIRYPGGEGRKTALADMGDAWFAIAKRASLGRAKLEAVALTHLADSGIVPVLVRREGRFVVQEALTGTRLSQALEDASKEDRHKLLMEAGESLLALQQLGRRSGLIDKVPEIGARAGWAQDFASVPHRLAQRIGVELTGYDQAGVAEILSQPCPAFVKWDARPGNAFVQPAGRVVWFDWEHCGKGSVEDDLVWLLADEWAPISAKAETTLIARFAAAAEVSEDALTRRFRIKALLHTAIRVMLILEHKGTGPWWSVESALANDRVGVSLPHVRRLTRRGIRWAESLRSLSGVAALLRAVRTHTQSLP